MLRVPRLAGARQVLISVLLRELHENDTAKTTARDAVMRHCRKEATTDSKIQRQRSVVFLTYICTRRNIAVGRETAMRVRTLW
jgi:hypothetical protein